MHSGGVSDEITLPALLELGKEKGKKRGSERGKESERERPGGINRARLRHVAPQHGVDLGCVYLETRLISSPLL